MTIKVSITIIISITLFLIYIFNNKASDEKKCKKIKIKGVVIDKNGKPIHNAVISTNNPNIESEESDSKGNFTLNFETENNTQEIQVRFFVNCDSCETFEINKTITPSDIEFPDCIISLDAFEVKKNGKEKEVEELQSTNPEKENPTNTNNTTRKKKDDTASNDEIDEEPDNPPHQVRLVVNADMSKAKVSLDGQEADIVEELPSFTKIIIPEINKSYNIELSKNGKTIKVRRYITKDTKEIIINDK